MRDLMGIMKQAQAMQQKMQDVQAELDTIEVEGSSPTRKRSSRTSSSRPPTTRAPRPSAPCRSASKR